VKPANGKLIVRVNMAQKNTWQIAGTTMKIANLYQTNHREKEPVLGEIVEGNKIIRPGRVCIFHHNNFAPPSPFFLYGDLFSVPYNKTVFGILYSDGTIRPLCGNILCNRVDIESNIPLPSEQKERYIDRVIVTNPGDTSYKAGQLLFTRPYAFYEIVYNIGGTEYRVHKIHEDNVVGVE
jgi:hypothetical protein